MPKPPGNSPQVLGSSSPSLIAVDLGHPDLIGISGTDYIDDDDDSYPEDKNAHGTACAGLAASIGNNEIGGAGVAYDAEVYGVRMLGGPISMSETYDAFVSSVDAGASVISNSWGYKNSCDGYALPQLLREALQYAEEQGRDGLGTLVIQAAGNDNCDISSDGLLAYETVVAVAALGAGDGKESYSSYGAPIDIAAPSGGLITTTVDGAYGKYKDDPLYTAGMSGTAATPVAAGVFALMFSVNERLTAADARDIVCQTATRNDILNGDFNSEGWSPYFGCGRIDAGAAVFAVAKLAHGTRVCHDRGHRIRRPNLAGLVRCARPGQRPPHLSREVVDRCRKHSRGHCRWKQSRSHRCSSCGRHA